MIDYKETTGADLLIETLVLEGVENIFGCQSDGIVPFPRLISDNSDVKYLQFKHEQAAVHAADGYARATGKPGVALVSTASGVTNAVTGIATAHSDSVPIVVIAVSQSYFNSNREVNSELNFADVFVPITKHIFHVTEACEVQTVIGQAFHIAAEGRPGPVVVVMSDEALHQRTLLGGFGGQPVRKHTKPVKISNEKAFTKAVKLIEKAKKPVLFIGGGVISSGAAELLREIARHSSIPVVSSLMGLGAMRSTDPNHLGMLGMHGTFASNKAVHRSDLLISVGARFSDRVTGKISGFSPKSTKIHVDVDPAEINKIIQVDLPIVSDAKEFLDFVKINLDFARVRANIMDWAQETSTLKRTVPRFDKSNSILSPQTVVRMLDEFSSEDAVVVTDVGQHQMWTANHYHFTKPRTLITSGGLGTMGYGLPAAIGAMVGSPMKDVICVSGDGSFQMNLQELITAVQYRLPIKIAILNNGYLGMVRQWQEMFYDRRYSSVKMTSPDFVKLAGAYGVAGFRAGTEEEARVVMMKAFLHEGPVLMEFNIIEEENVFPIVPPNHSNEQLILSR